MTFPSVDHITYEITKAVDRWGNQKIPVVLDCHHIQYADYTAAESIRDMIGNLKKEKHDLVFWKLKRSILRVLLGVMYGSGIAFVHCHTETDVEAIIDSKNEWNMRWSLVISLFYVNYFD
jgi:MFS superfamily sulfate permease-like transporter